MLLSLCACENGEKTKGTYKSFSMFLNNTYHLNENGTYDKEPDANGSYKTDLMGGLVLSQPNSSSEEIFAKSGDFYYKTNLSCSFEKDTKYGLEVSFDEKGRSNQSFTANYEIVDPSSMLVKKLDLVLNDSGTYKLDDMQIYITNGEIVDLRTFEGEYHLKDDIFWLHYKGTDYPILLVDKKLYFNVMEKVKQ